MELSVFKQTPGSVQRYVSKEISSIENAKMKKNVYIMIMVHIYLFICVVVVYISTQSVYSIGKHMHMRKNKIALLGVYSLMTRRGHAGNELRAPVGCLGGKRLLHRPSSSSNDC